MAESSAPAIRLRDVVKTYVVGIPVLSGVDLDVPHGLVTALVGANGCGKSTLVKILSGYHAPDKGSQIWINGQEVEGHVSPEAARAAGLRFVHQDSTLVHGLSVLDNMLVGNYRTGFGYHIRWAAERASVQAELDRWHIDVDVRDDPRDLPLATVAKLAIVRAMRTTGDEHLSGLVLDEPTAALGRDDAREMLTWTRELAAREDVGVLLIGHRIEEILSAADKVAVLRSGRIVAEQASAELTRERLVQHIVGRPVDAFYPDRSGTVSDSAALEVAHLRGRGVADLSFSLARGEVLGVTGLPGSGFEDVPYLLMDPASGAQGQLRLGGEDLDPQRSSIATRVDRGMALVPDDRKRRAIATDLSLRENLCLPRLRTFIRRGLLHRSEEATEAERLIDEYGVQASGSRVAASSLSGGNQQKVVLAKWMSTRPSVLVVHEPTHGVDVGAKADIFQLLASAAEAGMSTVIVSVECEDLAHLCDRVLVMGDGHVAAELSGSQLTTDQLTTAVFMAARQDSAA
ncbi:MAG: Monosaccharide transporter ATP-binding protein family [Modestobacter sp.]|jgi:ribose transport system ATP-binding protein|nr:Monosaccharide transporter ATP-binding protein family [Modestobacter sp.]